MRSAAQHCATAQRDTAQHNTTAMTDTPGTDPFLNPGELQVGLLAPQSRLQLPKNFLLSVLIFLDLFIQLVLRSLHDSPMTLAFCSLAYQRHMENHCINFVTPPSRFLPLHREYTILLTILFNIQNTAVLF